MSIAYVPNNFAWQLQFPNNMDTPTTSGSTSTILTQIRWKVLPLARNTRQSFVKTSWLKAIANTRVAVDSRMENKNYKTRRPLTPSSSKRTAKLSSPKGIAPMAKDAPSSMTKEHWPLFRNHINQSYSA